MYWDITPPTFVLFAAPYAALITTSQQAGPVPRQRPLQHDAQAVAAAQLHQRPPRPVRVGRQGREGDGALAQVLDPHARPLEREAAEPAHRSALELLRVVLLDQAGDQERVVEPHGRQLTGRRPHEREVAGAQGALETGVGILHLTRTYVRLRVKSRERRSLQRVVRPSDDTRSHTLAALRRGYASGRLQTDTFDLRVEQALTADTRGELRELAADLPHLRWRDRIRPPARRGTWLADPGLLSGAELTLWPLTGLSSPVFCDDTVSRHHARLELRDGRWFLVDLDSSNGTLVNGRAGARRRGARRRPRSASARPASRSDEAGAFDECLELAEGTSRGRYFIRSPARPRARRRHVLQRAPDPVGHDLGRLHSWSSGRARRG